MQAGQTALAAEAVKNTATEAGCALDVVNCYFSARRFNGECQVGRAQTPPVTMRSPLARLIQEDCCCGEMKGRDLKGHLLEAPCQVMHWALRDLAQYGRYTTSLRALTRH